MERRVVFSTGRKSGHIKAHEDVSDWERFWVELYSAQGYGYRQVAALTYGVTENSVTDDEIARVGRIARAAGCGCNQYRTMRNDVARDRLRELHRDEKQACPPLLHKLKLASSRSSK